MKRSLLKKLIVLTLSIAILLNALPLMVASAAETATITATADKSSYAVGDTVVVDVAVSEVTVKSIGLSWTYDDAVLEFVSATWALTGVIADVEEEAPRAAFAYDEATATAGKIFTLTFTVLKDAEDTSVVVTPVLKNGAAVIAAESATATVSFACKHENIGDWEKDATNHWKSCECGEVLDEGTHVFANACDVDCDTCGYTREVDGHVYDNDCDATCNTCGETRMVGDHVYDNACDATCNSCGEEREVGDHEYSDWQNVEEGHFKVCTECSTQTAIEPHVYDNDCDFDCNVCGATRNVDGHQFSETYENDETGHWYECTTCGEKTDVLPHAFDNDCDDKCDTCGYTREVAGHQFGEYKYNDVTHWKECSICGTFSEDGDHKFGEWVEDTAATNTSNGSKHRDCVCGKTETAVIPAIMKFSNASLILESNLCINFKMKPEYITTYGYSVPYVVFTMGGVETVVTEYAIEGTGTSQRYVYSFSNIAPYLMTQDVTAVLYAEYNGELYSGTPQNYSVTTYCYNQLGKSAVTSNAKLRTLIVDLLNYGTEAQVKWNQYTDNLANARLTATQAAWATQTTPTYTDYTNANYAVVDNATATWKAIGLVLKEAVVMRFRFVSDDITGYTVKIEADGEEWIIENSDISYDSASGRYQVYFDKLFAFQMRTEVFVTVYKDGVPVSNTLRYSVESYAKRNKDASYFALVDAMMKYGDSAEAYFG